jgi:hypothetical protein
LAANAVRPPSTPPARDRLRARVFIALATVFGVLLVSGVAALWYRHDRAIAFVQRRIDNQALILSEHFHSSADAIDATLKQLAVHGQRIGGAGAARHGPGAQAAYSGPAWLGSLTVTDDAGDAAATIRSWSMVAGVFFLASVTSRQSQAVGADRNHSGRARRPAADPARAAAGSTDGKFDGVIVSHEPPACADFINRSISGRMG